MISGMTEFFTETNTIIKKLIDINDYDNATRLQNTLRISGSSLEILGQVRQEIRYLESKKIIKKIGYSKEAERLKKFIGKYWK